MAEAVEPNPEFLERLLEIGINADVAKKALITTNNESLELATSLALDMGDEWIEPMYNFKMTFVVNSALNMGVGKIASQVAHATLALFQQLTTCRTGAQQIEMWQQKGEKKVILKGNDADHLLILEKEAKFSNVPSILITDAGRTQVPQNSLTVFALFGIEDEINKITGTLDLL